MVGEYIAVLYGYFVCGEEIIAEAIAIRVTNSANRQTMLQSSCWTTYRAVTLPPGRRKVRRRDRHCVLSPRLVWAKWVTSVLFEPIEVQEMLGLDRNNEDDL